MCIRDREFLNAALNEQEEAHQAFRQWLAAKDLETTHWILGELGIRTVSSLVNLTEKQFEDTLELFPPKRPGEPGDMKDPQRYAPAHVAGVRQLRDLLRKRTPGAAVVGVQPGQANDQEEAQTPEAAMEAATQEAVKQLKEAQEMVQKLVDNGSTAQHIADALVFLDNAVVHFNLGKRFGGKCSRDAEDFEASE